MSEPKTLCTVGPKRVNDHTVSLGSVETVHAPDCVGHSECSCPLASLRARVAALLREIETNRASVSACPACGYIGQPDTGDHSPDCALRALLCECEG